MQKNSALFSVVYVRTLSRDGVNMVFKVYLGMNTSQMSRDVLRAYSVKVLLRLALSMITQQKLYDVSRLKPGNVVF